MRLKFFIVCVFSLTSVIGLRADNGSLLWLKQPISTTSSITTKERMTPTLAIAVQELKDYWTGAPIKLIKQQNKQLNKEGSKIITKPQHNITHHSDRWEERREGKG